MHTMSTILKIILSYRQMTEFFFTFIQKNDILDELLLVLIRIHQTNLDDEYTAETTRLYTQHDDRKNSYTNKNEHFVRETASVCHINDSYDDGFICIEVPHYIDTSYFTPPV